MPDAVDIFKNRKLPETSMPSSFTKGARVEFDHQGETHYGVVSRGGAKAKVVIDGGKVEYSVPASLLRDSAVPLPKDPPHPMDSWSLKGYAEVAAMSEETAAFTATVLRDGKPALSAKNDGRGGCNSYYPITGGYATVAALEESAKQWLVDHGMPPEDCFEAADMWLSWKAGQAPYGVTAKAFVESWIETMAEMRGETEAPAPR